MIFKVLLKKYTITKVPIYYNSTREVVKVVFSLI